MLQNKLTKKKSITCAILMAQNEAKRLGFPTENQDMFN